LALAGLLASGANMARGAGLSRYISPDFCAVLVINNVTRTQNSVLADARSALPPDAASANQIAAAKQMLRMRQKDLPRGMDLDKLFKLLEGKPARRVVVVVEPAPAANLPLGVGIIVQFDAEIDGEAILSAITTQWESADVAGVQYKKIKSPLKGFAGPAALAPDAKTLILGMDVTVAKMLAKNEGDRPLLKQLQQSSFDNFLLVEFLAAPLLAKLPEISGKSLDETLAVTGNPAVAKDVQSASIKLNLSGDTLAHVEIVCGKAESATMLAAMTNMGVGIGKTQFEEFKKKPSVPMLPSTLVSLISKVGDEVFAALTVKADGPKLVVHVPMPESLPELLKEAVALQARMTPPPGGTGPR